MVQHSGSSPLLEKFLVVLNLDRVVLPAKTVIKPRSVRRRRRDPRVVLRRKTHLKDGVTARIGIRLESLGQRCGYWTSIDCVADRGVYLLEQSAERWPSREVHRDGQGLSGL